MENKNSNVIEAFKSLVLLRNAAIKAAKDQNDKEAIINDEKIISEALTAFLELLKWEPIKTAPKDRLIMVYDPEFYTFIEQWTEEDGYGGLEPTYWKELPQPPNQEENKAQEEYSKRMSKQTKAIQDEIKRRNSMGTEKILYSSARAAQLVTLTGWLSSEGSFFPLKKDPEIAERNARWRGCTHIICRECKTNIHERSWACCKACREKKADERYNEFEYREWNGEPVCIYTTDTYFFSIEEFEDWLNENESEAEDVQLVICEAQYANPIDGAEHFYDLLPEGHYLHDIAPKLAEALDNLNKVIEEEKEIISYYPSNIRTTIKI